MVDELNVATKLEIYRLVLNRYKDIINEKESLTISEMRQKVSPYNDTIRKLRDDFTKDMIPYNYKLQFFDATQRAISYIRDIKTCEFAFSFWMDFEEMDKLKIGTAMNKAIMLTTLLRSLESDDVRIIVTKKGKSFVKFSWENHQYLFVPESGSFLMGDDALKVFADDPPAYSFNDLVYESYEEE
ncbi:hypothetical protein KKB44_06120 [Candidatus Micrarchaeota archaeon]|nr:hypothetical protein [Candidatus Micrarchaeota archaeon]